MTHENRKMNLGNCLAAALAYVATTWFCLWLLEHSLLDAPLMLRTLVSLLPVVPILFAIRAVVRLLLAGDEMQRRIDLEALAIAAVAVGLGCLTLSLLLVANVIALSARDAMRWVFPAQWIAYGLARIWAQRRYQ
ncbi:MAG TPA: hypothetical protein VFN25_07210 [Dokdonella sp.]|uniref:hypothetical protein n=1 Tax=Dokdonella sp. TaxID=2291710 RepID=UPI002D7E36F1|nr:hypothetical protein [Dokdonella sp.]HET9032678.1 hypothetical protein [Dokdonella sp.]